MKKKMPPKPPGLNLPGGQKPAAQKGSYYMPYWPGSNQNPNRKDSGKDNRKRKQ